VCSNIAKLVFMGKRECFKLLTIGSVNGTIGIDRSHTRQASRAVTGYRSELRDSPIRPRFEVCHLLIQRHRRVFSYDLQAVSAAYKPAVVVLL
jgi:hypothetical protein